MEIPRKIEGRELFDLVQENTRFYRSTSNDESKHEEIFLPLVSTSRLKIDPRRSAKSANRSIVRFAPCREKQRGKQAVAIEESFERNNTPALLTVVVPTARNSCFHRSRAFAKNSWRETLQREKWGSGAAADPTKTRADDETRIIKRFFLLAAVNNASLEVALGELSAK